MSGLGTPVVSPYYAPFSRTVIPPGWARTPTQSEVDQANAKYPVPPYGKVYWNPKTSLAVNDDS